MADQDVGPIAELGALVTRYAGEGTASQVMAGSEQIAAASPPDVARWLKGAMDRLNDLVDKATRRQIMENMGFNCAEMNKSHVKRALAKRRRFATLEEFLEAEGKKPMRGTRLVRDGDTVYQYYTPLASFGRRCYCGLWRGLAEDEHASLTWCQCGKGFVMKVWEAYLGRPAGVELVESCISGAGECTFAIDLRP